MVLLLRCVHRRKSVPVFEQENPRLSSSLPCFSDESEFLQRVSLLELRVRDARNSGMGALLCHRALLLRVPLASNILLVHRCFSPLWVPLIQIGVLVATLVLVVVAMRVPTAFAGWLFSGDSSGARGTQVQDVLPRPGGGQSSHSVEAALVLIGLMGAQIVLCFFLRVEAPQTEFINRHVHNPVLLSTMSWAMLRIINRVVELQGPG